MTQSLPSALAGGNLTETVKPRGFYMVSTWIARKQSVSMVALVGSFRAIVYGQFAREHAYL